MRIDNTKKLFEFFLFLTKISLKRKKINNPKHKIKPMVNVIKKKINFLQSSLSNFISL